MSRVRELIDATKKPYDPEDSSTWSEDQFTDAFKRQVLEFRNPAVQRIAPEKPPAPAAEPVPAAPPPAAKRAPTPLTPFHEEWDTASRLAELWNRRSEVLPNVSAVAREVGDQLSRDVTLALDDLRAKRATAEEEKAAKEKLAADMKAAEANVGTARDAATRAMDVAGRVFAQAAPVVVRAAPALSPQSIAALTTDSPIESRAEGTALPGEEQVTSMQTLDALPPEVRAGLEKKYQSGGHADTMSFEDWVSENFSDLPPDARANAMRRSATSTPRIQAGRDPNLRPGEMSEVAQARRAAGKPLPEGREPNHYTPEQLRTMSRNTSAPEMPMQRHGGTMILNADGSMSMRAPDPAKLKLMQEIAADPEQTENSLAWLMAAADAYGIDAIRYGDDVDLLREDVNRQHLIHAGDPERGVRGMLDHSVIVPTNGGFRYSPNAEARAAAKNRSVMNFAGDMVVRYGRLLSPEDQNQLLALGEAGDMQALQRFRARMEPLFRDQRTRAARDRAATFNMTRDMNNAAMAPGMRARALMQQIAENNPDGAAGISQIFGDQQQVPMWLNRANAQAAADAQRAQVLLDEEEKKKTERQEALGVVGINQQRIEAIQNEPDPAKREVMARSFARDNMTVEGSPPPTEEAVNREAAVVLATLDLPANPSPDDVRALFERFKEDKAAFYSLGERLRSRGVTQEMVDKMWAQMSGTSARDRGRATAQGVQDTLSGIGGFIGGLFGY